MYEATYPQRFLFSFPTVTCGWDHGPCFFQWHFQFIFELRQTLGYVFKGALRRSSRWAIWRIPGSGEMLWNIRRRQKWSFFKQPIINLNDLIQVYDICCNVHFRHLDRIVLSFLGLWNQVFYRKTFARLWAAIPASDIWGHLHPKLFPVQRMFSSAL